MVKKSIFLRSASSYNLLKCIQGGNGGAEQRAFRDELLPGRHAGLPHRAGRRLRAQPPPVRVTTIFFDLDFEDEHILLKFRKFACTKFSILKILKILNSEGPSKFLEF